MAEDFFSAIFLYLIVKLISFNLKPQTSMLDKFIEYIKYEKRYSPHTIKAYEKDLIEYYDYSEVFQGEANPLKLNFQQHRHYLVYLQDQDYSNRTINRKISSLKRFYKYLISIGEISDNPTAKLSALKFEKKVMIPFSKEEMIELLDKIDYGDDFEGVRDKLIISVFYYTGIRLSELIGIKISKVDFANSQLKVLGKRNKERIIPLSYQLINSIKSYMKLREEFQNTENEDVFFITKNGKQIYPSLVYGKINHYLSTVTKKVKRSPHVIRHTFATHLMDAGADLNSIKELLGHSSLVATQVYMHSSLVKLKSIVNQAHPRAKKSKPMKVKVQAVDFKADKELLDFLQKKMDKLDQFYDKIIDGVAYLKLGNKSDKENKISEIKIMVPGDELVVKKKAASFEASIDQCADSLARMLRKKNDKVKAHVAIE